MPNRPAPFDAEFARRQVAATRFAALRYVAQTQSTNADVQPLLGDPAAAGTTIVADYQSAGVGRKGRRWFAPPGAALLFTAILPEPLDPKLLWCVPFWVALAVAAAVERSSGVALELVWPNDLHVRGAKIGGILSVARIAGADAWIGCGVGLNLLRPPADADLDALDPQPAFLDDLTARVHRESILAAILQTFDATFEDLHEPQAVVAHWERRAALAGTIYRYRNDADGTEREGVAQRLGPRGALIVVDGGQERTIDMADVRVTGRKRV